MNTVVFAKMYFCLHNKAINISYDNRRYRPMTAKSKISFTDCTKTKHSIIVSFDPKKENTFTFNERCARLIIKLLQIGKEGTFHRWVMCKTESVPAGKSYTATAEFASFYR